MFRLCSLSCFEIVITLATEVITFYMQVLIVKIGVFDFGWPIAGRKIYVELVMLFALYKQL